MRWCGVFRDEWRRLEIATLNDGRQQSKRKYEVAEVYSDPIWVWISVISSFFKKMALPVAWLSPV